MRIAGCFIHRLRCPDCGCCVYCRRSAAVVSTAAVGSTATVVLVAAVVLTAVVVFTVADVFKTVADVFDAVVRFPKNTLVPTKNLNFMAF